MTRNPKLVLYEPDQIFAARICDYWSNQKGFPFEIACFSNYEKWRSAYPKMTADVWLIDSSIAEEMQREGLSGRVLIWTDDESQETAIYKYRSADILMQTLKDCLDATGTSVAADQEQICVIGLYSPMKSVLQTVMGMEIARLLTAFGQVLYLPLSGFWAMKDLQTDYYSKDISDFMYFLAGSEQQSTVFIQNYILERESIEFLAAVDNPDSLRTIAAKEWLDFLDFWKKSGRYQYVILDIGPEICEVPKLLQGCIKIFSVAGSNSICDGIWRQYEQYLEATGNLSLMSRTERVHLPEGREDFGCMETTDYKSRLARELLSGAGLI
ncbi:MAG: hypothetical protein LUH19_00330 [Lachnospiraceae bacterium]|nr:hypothetical protein [Lachnospiraceae bacterium]